MAVFLALFFCLFGDCASYWSAQDFVEKEKTSFVKVASMKDDLNCTLMSAPGMSWSLVCSKIDKWPNDKDVRVGFRPKEPSPYVRCSDICFTIFDGFVSIF